MSQERVVASRQPGSQEGNQTLHRLTARLKQLFMATGTWLQAAAALVLADRHQHESRHLLTCQRQEQFCMWSNQVLALWTKKLSGILGRTANIMLQHSHEAAEASQSERCPARRRSQDKPAWEELSTSATEVPWDRGAHGPLKERPTSASSKRVPGAETSRDTRGGRMRPCRGHGAALKPAPCCACEPPPPPSPALPLPRPSETIVRRRQAPLQQHQLRQHQTWARTSSCG